MSSGTPRDLYLRHLTVDEALYRLDQYLNDAFMAGHWQVRVVHGKGQGIIRDVVWKALAKHPLVKSYRLGLPGEGSEGATVVELEQRR